MKAITIRIQKSSRPLVILLTAFVAIITSMVVANATQTITTPNAAFISFSLAPGATSAPITPATNRSVLVMGCCTNAPQVGQVGLFHSSNGRIAWTGLEAAGTGITSGASITANTHIVYIDNQNLVAIQVASVNTIQIHSGISFGTVAGNVTLIW
jgi:hypothetical protein